mmetsp:Transcript_12894/g.24382  ORF Transcript_12894/g.24382 Transcript_12894/m.24382 type:complete len:84 (+) Transcript_12894:73-324(+)
MATTSDRFNINSQLEHLQAKYVGTGHPDIHRFDWMTNIHRDTYSTMIGNHNMISYVALCQNVRNEKEKEVHKKIEKKKKVLQS